MNRRLEITRRAAAALLVCVTLGAWSSAGVEDFKLSKVIPADAIVAMHSRSHSGTAFIDKQYERVWKAVAAQGFDRDLRRMIREGVKEDGGDLEQFDANWTKFSDLWNQVDLTTLCGNESAFAVSMSNKLPEMILLTLPDSAALDKNYPVFSNMLKALAELNTSELQAAEDKDGDLSLTRLSIVNAPMPMSLVVGRTKDILFLGMGAGWLEQCITLARGESGPTLASTPRFQAAFKQLPPGKDQITFVDVGRLMESVRGLIDMIPQDIDSASSEPAASPLAAMKKLIDGVDLWDYIAGTATTDGMKTTSETIAALRENANTRMLYPIWYGNGAIQEPFKYVPAEAGDMSASSGFDLLKLYQTALQFVRDNTPDAEITLAEWTAMQEQMELNVENDVFAWMGGKFTSFSIPGPTPYSPSESVFMISVRDESKAKAMMSRLFEAAKPLADSQQVVITELTEEGLEGFRSISHPMIIMIGMKEPTIGVRDGMLMLGASPKIIRKSLETAAGKNPNFGTNERYNKEGLPVTGNVISFSFSDQTSMGEQMGQAFKMAPMIANMAGGGSQEPGVKALLSMMSKLGNVFEKLDFFLSECSVSTFDGKVEITRTVTNYREPPSKATATTDRKSVV